MSLAEHACSPSTTTPPGVNGESTIDLRIADATREWRRLRALVQSARQDVEELESHRRSGGTTLETQTLEAHLGDLIVHAQNQVAREQADARRAAVALMAEAELQSRRRLEVAREEAATLRAVAGWLRVPRSGADGSCPASIAEPVDDPVAAILGIRPIPR